MTTPIVLVQAQTVQAQMAQNKEALGQKPTSQFINKKTGEKISQASPEDITPENYPDIIESFVFHKASIKDVIKAMSKDLNINIIMDDSIAGNKQISIISYSPITVAEAYQAFLSALAIHNLTVIRSGSFLKVVTTENAVKSNLKVYKDNTPVNSDQFITSIIKLKHIDAADLEIKIKPFLDKNVSESIIFFPPSNTVIISDYGYTVEKIRKIIKSVDVPSQDFIFKVFPIKHAQAFQMKKILSELLDSAYLGTRDRNRSRNRSRGTTPSTESQSINIRALTADERTNSIVAIGNREGINQIKKLIEHLDYYKDPDLAGGIEVYKVKHGIAEDLAKTLGELMGDQFKGTKQGARPIIRSPYTAYNQKNLQNVSTAQSFQDVKIIAEKTTNSLLIVANKHNYRTILNILKQVDISRNQVFVKSIIMELSADRSNDWQIANYFFQEGGDGIARAGYGLSKLTDIIGTGGATLMFPLSLFFKDGKNKTFLGQSLDAKTNINRIVSLENQDLSIGSQAINIPSLSSFIKFLQTNIGGNILSTPQVMALDHEKATVAITDVIPVRGNVNFSNQGNAFQGTTDKEIETLLEFTPHINPDVKSIRLQIEQKIDSQTPPINVPEDLRKTSVALKKRKIQTSITLKDKETAVLGGLVKLESTKSDSKVPLLGDLPLIGWLFKNSSIIKRKTNLIVFITPQIIHSAEEHQTILSNKLKERMSFIRQFSGNEEPYKDVIDSMKKPSEQGSFKAPIEPSVPAEEPIMPPPPDEDIALEENMALEEEEDVLIDEDLVEDTFEEENSVPEKKREGEDSIEDTEEVFEDAEEEPLWQKHKAIKKKETLTEEKSKKNFLEKEILTEKDTLKDNKSLFSSRP